MTLVRYNAFYLLIALLVPDGALAFILGAGVVGAVFFYPLLPAAAAGGLYVFVKSRRPSAETREITKPTAAPEAPSVPKQPRQVKQKDVVDFFFHIFSRQVGETTTSEVALLESRKKHFTHVYEFTATFKGKKNHRRMTVSNIGEDAAARSRCFYVIYNTHLVVKIPPVPLKDYSQYIREIQRELEMVKLLAPVECVVPKVSVILRWLYPESASKTFTEAELEERYIQYAGMNPRVQADLKIGEGFAFFMELSTRYFLSSVLADLRNVSDRTTTELSACPEIVRDSSAFSGRYPSTAMNICFDLQSVYKVFEEKAQDRAGDAHYKLPGFFMRTIAGDPPSAKEMGLEPNAHAALVVLCKETIDQGGEAVDAYRDSVEYHVSNMVLSQNKPKLQALMASCLKLLSVLGKKKVAARDLKPDNLFITGDPAHYPAFLTDPERFSLGLIDLETSLCYAGAAGRIIQPPLAGTPLYATQTHLFDNGLITELFGDLGLVLCLQDWYAITGICHLLITGEVLFPRSARALGGITQVMATPQAVHNDPLHFAKEASRMFWQTAVSEFTDNTRKHRKSLEAVQVPVGGDVVAFLAPRFNRMQAEYDLEFRELVTTQTVFSDAKSRRVLAEAGYEKLLLQRKKISADSGPEKAARAITLLTELSELKYRASAYERALDAFMQQEPVVDAITLMTCLFFSVYRGMYREEWG